MSEEEWIKGLGELKNGLEALVNLLYLIREDRKYPARVLRWVETSDVETKRMAQILSEKPVANDCFGVIHHCIHRKN
jgi:hypothetical protein